MAVSTRAREPACTLAPSLRVPGIERPVSWLDGPHRGAARFNPERPNGSATPTSSRSRVSPPRCGRSKGTGVRSGGSSRSVTLARLPGLPDGRRRYPPARRRPRRGRPTGRELCLGSSTRSSSVARTTVGALATPPCNTFRRNRRTAGSVRFEAGSSSGRRHTVADGGRQVKGSPAVPKGAEAARAPVLRAR